MKRLALFALVLGMAMILATGASAITINYGDLTGATVQYLQVTESNSDTIAYFGPPEIVGGSGASDIMDFDPVNFKVQSSGVQGAQLRDGQLNFIVMTRPNNPGLSRIIINEAGDFTLSALPPAQLAAASVSTTVNFRITEVNNQGLSTPCVANGVRMPIVPVGTGVPNPVGGNYITPGDLGSGVPWSGILDFNVAALLASCGVTGNATKVEVSLDNTLTANSANGGAAFIAKKDASGVTVNVPEPGFGPILCLLVGSVLMIRRRFVR